MNNINKAIEKLTPAQFREKFKVCGGTLANGNKVEVLSWKITVDNMDFLPSPRSLRNYLIELYNNRINFLVDSGTTAGDTLIYEFPAS